MNTRTSEKSSATEGGFTLVEVSIASVVSMISLIFLASLFTLAIYQNRHVKQTTSATALAQMKMEELLSVQPNDSRLQVGGGINPSSPVANYNDNVYVMDTGTVSTTQPTSGVYSTYQRFWNIQSDPDANFTNSVIVTVYVQAAYNTQGTTRDQATLVTERSTQ